MNTKQHLRNAGYPMGAEMPTRFFKPLCLSGSTLDGATWVVLACFDFETKRPAVVITFVNGLGITTTKTAAESEHDAIATAYQIASAYRQFGG